MSYNKSNDLTQDPPRSLHWNQELSAYSKSDKQQQAEKQTEAENFIREFIKPSVQSRSLFGRRKK